MAKRIKDNSVERRIIDIADAVKSPKKQDNRKVKKYAEPEDEPDRLGKNDFMYDNRTLEKRSIDEYEKYSGPRTRKDIPIDVVNEVEAMKVEGDFFRKFTAWVIKNNMPMMIDWIIDEFKQVILREGMPSRIKAYRVRKGVLEIEVNQPNEIVKKDEQDRWDAGMERRIRGDVWRFKDIYMNMHEWVIKEAIKEKYEQYKSEVMQDIQGDINDILYREKEKRDRLIADAQESERKRLDEHENNVKEVNALNYKIRELQEQVKDLSGRLNFLQKRKMRKEKEIKTNSNEHPAERRVKVRYMKDNNEGFGNIRKWK